MILTMDSYGKCQRGAFAHYQYMYSADALRVMVLDTRVVSIPSDSDEDQFFVASTFTKIAFSSSERKVSKLRFCV